ncbi:MAG: hypothetical protein B6I20_09280 [Bacteroidetes bacterium 4572_117]|nr:MAG: hypothetical protein B6I20_09280 [Bacteroidetes bacterium 4572_117]
MSNLQNIDKNLLQDLSKIIEQGKKQVAIQANSVLTLTYWQVGKRINDNILQNKRAEYGKEVVKKAANFLVEKYGRGFSLRNIRRMRQFANEFPDIEIVTPLVAQLSWSHFISLFSIKNKDARMFYAKKSIEASWGKRELKKQIERKVYERTEIAKIQKPVTIKKDFSEINVFKDPYFLDFLGLKDSYLEKDLEAAIIKEMELFILELGNGFSFIERQKRIIIDGKDFYLDLLFFHRKLKRLVAIELKLGEFKASYKGQMELYLKWLNRYEKEEGENMPIGLILCTEASREQIELLEMHKEGIMVAEYWKDLPPKEKLEQKLHSILLEVKERMETKKILEEN